MDRRESYEPNQLGLIEWLASQECRVADEAGLIEGLAQRLRALPLPVDGITLYLRALHPEIRARIVVWSPKRPVEVHDRKHAMPHIAAFAGSPLRQAMETGEWQSARASEDTGLIDAHALFRNRGIAELLTAPLDGAGSVTFATCRARGFAPPERRVLERVLPALSVACEVKTLRRLGTTLLDTYVGEASGRRILAGRIRRGEVERLKAALMFCDLRNFTALSDQLPVFRILDQLNLYFDQVVPAITAGGGEVLKFIGDAVLAFFDCGDGPAASCAAAFAAAKSIERRLASASAGPIPLRAGIGLHYGEVSYGNIGSGRRLDFTVIGRDVNLLSRIHGVCGENARSLIMSDRFAGLLGGANCRSIGRHALKGFADPEELFE
jgi:adenylate cyclase